MSDGAQMRMAILVAGMHRSGTSALTRVLNIAGCDLPETLIEARPDNVSGFWESAPVVDLNQEILASAGSSWDDWRPFPGDWYESPVAEEFRERAATLVRSVFGGSRLFVLKDPRVCRLLGFWTEAVSACGVMPLVVSPIRNPFDIASSLHVRSDIDPGAGQLIWLRHVLDAEAASRGVRRAFLRYETLLEEPHAVVKRLENDLGVILPRASSPYAEMDIDEFLSPVLHHHSSDDRSHRSHPHLSIWIKEGFEILDRWARGEVREEDAADLDRIKAAFDDATPAFSRAMAAGRIAARSNRELRKELDGSQRDLGKSRRELEESRRELEELRRELDSSRRALEESQREWEDSRREREQRDERIRALSEDLEIARRGHVMALAQRRSRIGADEVGVDVLLDAHWLDQARRESGREPVLEFRRNGRKVTEVPIPARSGGVVRIPVRPRIHAVGDTLFSVHDASSGVALAALATPALRRARHVVGGVESRERPEVRGWVLDTRTPECARRVAFYLDGTLREVVVADLWREDIARSRGTGGRHGFLWRVPAALPVRDGTRIDIFDADTGRALEGSPVRLGGGRAVRSERRGGR